MQLTPKKIVTELNKHIIGQDDAKRAVAIALRNRWRRMQLSVELRNEVKPKNILMIGPTGVGKTEIGRRVAKLVDAPFIKVEATKYTEIGYVGRDVESIIRDLMDIAIKQARERGMEKVAVLAKTAAEERILNALLPAARVEKTAMAGSVTVEAGADVTAGVQDTKDSETRQIFRKKLLAGELNDKEIEIDIAVTPAGIEIMTPPGMEEMSSQLQSLFQTISSERTKTRKMSVKDALKIIQEEEAGKLINEEDLKLKAIEAVEQNGIVFIDELDKVTNRSNAGESGQVSREGVQRDLLPLIEGCTVFTKYGMIKTDHILFIASGAFHLSKPSDLIPELQGRLPIRVELSALSTADFVRILTEPDESLTKQYIALMATEKLHIEFTEDSVQCIAKIAWEVNENVENIGARRLYTVMERLLEPFSFDADERKGEKIVIDAKYVEKQLANLVKNRDLSQYIL